MAQHPTAAAAATRRSRAAVRAEATAGRRDLGPVGRRVPTTRAVPGSRAAAMTTARRAAMTTAAASAPRAAASTTGPPRSGDRPQGDGPAFLR